MRLTLRTLLSYLDEVHLSGEEREAIRRQIEASENAGEWIHRTRDVVRRLKVGTPEIGGSGSADDPNSVAEYLDRTLPDESVAEFERVCLESDPLLAEVAACHHVLAMFLSDAAEIDPDTRNRLHRLQADLAEVIPARSESPQAAPPAAAVPTPPVQGAPAAVPPRRRKTAGAVDGESGVPGYLRDQPSGEWKRWLPALAALLLLAVTAGIAFLPGGPLNPAEVAQNGEPPEAPSLWPEVGESEAQESEPAPKPIDEEVDPSSDPAEAEGTAAEEGVVDPMPVMGEPEGGASEVDLGPAIEEEAGGEEPTVEVLVADAPAEPDTPAEDEPVPAIVYQSEPSTLGVYELLPNRWRRLERGFEVAGPTRMISLPSYRNTFALSPELTLEAVGLTDMTLSPPGDGGEFAQIKLNHGRLLLSHAVSASAPAAVELVIDGDSHRVAIDPGAVLAIRADRLFQPGWPVEDSSPPTVAIGDTLAGVVEWTTGAETERVPMPKGKRLSGEETEPLVEYLGDNDWVERLPINQVEEDASIAIAEGIVPGKPVWPQLRTIASKDRFKERRALAALASASVGHPESLIESFTDGDQGEVWERDLAWLRQTASHDSAGAKTIRRVFEEEISSQATDDLMDLLIGFTPQEIGADPEALARGSLSGVVIPAMESPDLATRVLASLVLNEVVTGAEGVFDPSQTERRRAGAMKKIRYRLEDGDLKPRDQ